MQHAVVGIVSPRGLRLEIGCCVLNQDTYLHILHIEHFVIQSELKNLVIANVLGFQKSGSSICKIWSVNNSFRNDSGLQPLVFRDFRSWTVAHGDWSCSVVQILDYSRLTLKCCKYYTWH